MTTPARQPLSPRRLATPALTALPLLAVAALVDGEQWVRLFEQPGRDSPATVDLLRAGAVWLRIMLALLGLSLFLGLPFLGRPRSEASTAPGGTCRSRGLWIVLAIIVIGLLARATRLTESLWYDEIAAWASYGVHGPAMAVSHYFDPANHIAHSVASWCSMTMLGDALGAELALRMPALIASLISIGAIMGLAREAGGDRVAVIAGLLAALLPVCVLEGAEARGYSMMIASSVLTTWLLMRARQRSIRLLWVAYVITCATGVWAHPVTAFVAAGHFVWAIWRGWQHGEARLAREATISITLSAVLTLALYAPVIPAMLAIRETFGSSGETPGVLGVEGWHTLLALGGSWYWWAGIPGLAAFLLGLSATSRDDNGTSIAVASLLGLPLFIATVLVLESWMYARFALFVIPGAIVMMSLGLETIWRRHRAAGIALLTVIIGVSIADLIARPPKQPLREAATYVDEQSPHTPVLVVGLYHEVLSVYGGDLDLRYTGLHGQDFSRAADAHPSARWLVLYYEHNVSDAALAAIRSRGFEFDRRFPGWADWTNGDVVVMRRRR